MAVEFFRKLKEQIDVNLFLSEENIANLISQERTPFKIGNQYSGNKITSKALYVIPPKDIYRERGYVDLGGAYRYSNGSTKVAETIALTKEQEQKLKEFIEKSPITQERRKKIELMQKIQKTYSSTKENSSDSLPLYMQYEMDRRHKDFDPKTSKVGLIVTADSDNFDLDGVLSRNGNILVIHIPYANIRSEIIENPKVKSFEVCDREITKLLQDNQGQEVTIKLPWSGPVGDEWDSPSYDEFWGLVEQNINKRIKTLERVGKKVKVI